jgi:hypothetical protein
MSVTDKVSVTNCQHATTEWLGFKNGTAFLRCLTCRSVIVTQGGMSLAVPPAQTAGLSKTIHSSR